MAFTLIRAIGSVEFGNDGSGYALRYNKNVNPILYDDTQASDSVPGGMVGVCARQLGGGFEVVLKKSNSSFVAWSVDTSGNYLAARDLTTSEVYALEDVLDEDLDEDGNAGPPPPVEGSSGYSEGVIEQARQATHLLGSSPEFTRTFRVYLLSETSTSAITGMCGVSHNSPHPDYPDATCYSIEIEAAASDDDGGQIVATVTAKYKVSDTQQNDPLPWMRGDSWKFQTQGVAVPALTYWDGNTQKPMTNSAGDWIEGVTVDEAQQKITITGNRQSFPSALAAAVTNCVNDGTYLGFAANCIKVQGISGEMASEVVNGETVWYWKITSELLARQTGWNLLLPDVGYNFIEGGVKKRADVKGPDGEQIASANPIALDGSGGKQAGGALPAILDRRIYKQITMSTYFG